MTFIGAVDIAPVALSPVAEAEEAAVHRKAGSLRGRRRSLSSHKTQSSARKR